MNTENIDPRLWQLINTKDYVLLSEKEKIYVAAFISEDAYINWRKTSARTFKNYEEAFGTYAFGQAKLKNKLDKQFAQSNNSVIISVINHRIPLWQVAAMWICVLFGMGWYVLGMNVKNQELPLMAQVDTVFVPVASLPIHDTVYLQVKASKINIAADIPHPQIAEPDPIYIEDDRMIEKPWSKIEHDLENINTQGRTTSEDTISGRFMMGVL